MLEPEKWRAVKGYEGLYSISSYGRLLKRKSTRTIISRGRESKSKNKLIKGSLSEGYSKVILYKDGKIKRTSIHRLVAEAFILKPHDKYLVNHIDGNKQNNHVNNLEWVTYLENNSHFQQSKIRHSIYIGVCFHIIKKTWISSYRTKYLGSFKTELEAYQARQTYEKLNNITNKYSYGN